MHKIGVLIVTYNRLEKLKKALASYSEQTFKPALVMVVDNNSSKPTSDFLKVWEMQNEGFRKKVYRLEKNLGGSGGFYYGFSKMVETGMEWIWVSDDDAYPDKDCIEIMAHYISKSDTSKISAVCAAVLCSGSIDTWHRRRMKRKSFLIYEERIPVTEYTGHFEVDFLSYVGSMIKKDALLKSGNVRKDFFIAYDDSEHSIRLGKLGKMICIPEAKVVHDTDTGELTDCKACGIMQISWKKFYTIRNKLYSYRIHYGKVQAWLYERYYLMKNKDNIMRDMTKRAVLMSRRGKLGIDEIYMPGWKGSKK